MAKTLAQIITDARAIFGQTDSSNTSISDVQLTIWANDSYRDIVRALASASHGGVPISSRDYTITGGGISGNAVTLNSATLRLDTVRWREDSSSDFIELEVINIEQLMRWFPNWENEGSQDEPKYFVRTGTFAAKLYPTPNTSTGSQTVRVYGIESPSALSASSDTPDLPEFLHDLIPHHMAYRAFSFLENQDRAVAELTLYRGALKEGKGIASNYSTQQKGWKFDEVDDGSYDY
jgi:hypothetical protein